MKFIRNAFNIESHHSGNRIDYLDFVRGIFILLVLYHHATAPLHTYISQFHMPALFILSGYTEFLLNRKKPFLAYVKSKFFRLIVPYICFEVLNLLAYFFMKLLFLNVEFSFSDACISIITCINNTYTGLYGRLWFLPAIFIVSIFSYFIKHITKNNTYLVSLFCLLAFALSYISASVLPDRLPFTIDIAFLGTAFFLLGHICGNLIRSFFEGSKHLLTVLCLIVFGFLYILFNKIASPACHMYINEYSDFPFMILCATLGTAIVFIVAKYLFYVVAKITVIKNIIYWYSVNSLAVFPIHLTVNALARPLLRRVGLDNWICLFIIMLISTIPIVNIISNYFPFMLGSFNRKRL